MRWRALFASVGVVALISSLISTQGCGSLQDCTDLCKAQQGCCAPEFGCDPDSRDMDSCVSTCQALIEKDPAFGDTVDAQADCYEKHTCEEIRFQGECVDP